MRMEYDLTPEDYLRFAEYHTLHSPEGREKTRRYFIGVTLLVVGAGLMLSGVGYSLYLPFYASLALMPVFAVYLRKTRAQRIIKRGMEEARQQGYFGRWTLTLSAESVITECETIRSERQWKAICRVVSAAPGVAFYLSSLSFLMVPASAFSQEVERQAFLDAAMKYREQAAGIDTPS